MDKHIDAVKETATERFPRRAARRSQTRSRILNAAMAEFRKVGYADATMHAIAATADIHITTLFNHFNAKRDLANALADAELDKLSELINKSKGKIPFFEFFRSLVLATADERQKKGDHKRGLSRETMLDPELALGWMHYEGREIALLAAYIAADYGLDVENDYVASMAADALISSGVLSYSRWRRSRGSIDLVSQTEYALDLAERMARSILPLRPVTNNFAPSPGWA